MRRRFLVLPLLLFIFSLSASTGPAPAPPVDDSAFFAGLGDPATFNKVMEVRLERVRQGVQGLLAVKGTRTPENTLRVYDDIQRDLTSVGGVSSIISAVHPDDSMRKAAADMQQRAGVAGADIALNREIYDAIAAIDMRGADAETSFYVQRELRAYTLNGVDKDAATRDRLKDLRRQLADATQEFDRNIRSNTRALTVKDASELAGLPADYIARHKPQADGSRIISTDNSDVQPVMTFAVSEDVRKRLYFQFTNIAYPANIGVLDRMVKLRAQIANGLGYPNWASYDMADRMSGSLKAASDFIDRVVAASAEKADREYAEILKRKKQDVPGATVVNPWESAYYSELIRKENYNFDSQSVRPYFPYDRVRQGIFDVTGQLFGLTYQPDKDAPVWDPSVEVFKVLDGGKPVGRVYLDMHSRPNKQNNGATTYTIRRGIEGRQLPEIVIVASISGGRAGDPGLMAHDEVRTFFHEFGHQVHAVMSGHHQWGGIARVVERDFVEAPSQMLEEWIWDPATLATFARHYQTDQTIPAALVQQMRRASEFGKALGVRQQMVSAKLSLSLHDRAPQDVDSSTLVQQITNRYLPYPFAEDAHPQAKFTHLANGNYSASYYTYMWSLVIAKDLFSRFDAKNLLDPTVAHRYRDLVLAPGGSKPAATLVEDFLGRPFNEQAWVSWLNHDPS